MLTVLKVRIDLIKSHCGELVDILLFLSFVRSFILCLPYIPENE